MINDLRYRHASAWLAVAILAFLTFWFARFIQPQSFDLIQHFLLVDEIMKHGGVRPPPIPSLTLMAYYPPASHWLAAVVGWIGGSGLVGITIVSVVSVFVSYLLILLIVGIDSPVAVLLFAVFFFALQFTHSQIGWEVVGNFFYPQLVGDVAYFAVLLWLAHSRANWEQGVVVIAAGALAMWVQPIVAVHILAAGCFLMLLQTIERFKSKDPRLTSTIAWLIVMGIGALAILAFHPAFKTMRTIAANDGYLEFGYPHVMGIVAIGAMLGLFNAWRWLIGRSEQVDGVLAAALLGGVVLALAQFALLKLHHDGSGYAVKKHMFIIVTLIAMNGARAIVGDMHVGALMTARLRLITPIILGLMSFSVLRAFDMPAAPIVAALAYANNAATFELPQFAPGNTVTDDRQLPTIANVMISLSAFQHPYDERASSWPHGTSVKNGTDYAMVRRTAYIDQVCDQRLAETQTYVIAANDCIKNYVPGTPLSFAIDGNGWQYQTTGWGTPEPWGTWTIGDQKAGIDLIVPKGTGALTLILEGSAFVSKKHPQQTVTATVNGTQVATWAFTTASPSGVKTALLPASLTSSGALHVVFETPGAVSPQQVGASDDIRSLGVAIGKVTVTTAS